MALPQPSQLNQWTFRRVVWATLVLGLVFLSFWLLYRFNQVLFILFIAIVIGTVIRPAVAWLYRRRLPRTVGVVLIYLVLLALLTGFVLLLFPLIVEQGTTIAAAVPGYWDGAEIPCYMDTSKGPGQINRQCTHEWKIAPIRRYLQSNRNHEPVELWLGISLDEFQRIKESDVKYITHRWPLIEKRMTRHDCILWLQSHGLEVPPKSSCVFCPYHDSAAWRDMKLHGNGDWQKAVEVDRLIRKARPPWDLFVHPSRIPLEDVDLRNMEDRGQLLLWDAECEGYCGI